MLGFHTYGLIIIQKEPAFFFDGWQRLPGFILFDSSLHTPTEPFFFLKIIIRILQRAKISYGNVTNIKKFPKDTAV